MRSLRNSTSQIPHLPHSQGVCEPGGFLQRKVVIRQSCFTAQLVWSCEIPSAESFTDPCPRSLPMSQPGREHPWPFQPHCRTNCQCSSDLTPITPERDVARAHGSALCLLCSLGRGGQHCSHHPRFSISSILQLFTAWRKLMSQIPYKGPDTLLSAALAFPHPLPLCVEGFCGAS